MLNVRDHKLSSKQQAQIKQFNIGRDEVTNNMTHSELVFKFLILWNRASVIMLILGILQQPQFKKEYLAIYDNLSHYTVQYILYRAP